ncbi:MAG TPA: TcdA/TcdB catalytic glycosyltransferase domain-containing protein [Gammaproteobacteria bacterium]|jgi:hypothetical protein|nr:TcdA/TcdB catalytic glycosyltransferase domain-containing protein [Gammaproteobacteria bacterium]
MPGKLTESKNSRVIPQKIHFIWLGGPIPEEHLASIQKLALVANNSNFEVNIWVNDKNIVYKTLNKMTPDSLEMPKGHRVTGIRLRNIDELIPKMQRDPFFQKNYRLKKIIYHITREMVGFKNWAAASDWLRYIILYLEGGYYFDTDTRFKIGILDKLIPDQPHFGFKINRNDEEINNDIIAMLPKHELLKCMLIFAMNKYADFDAEIYTNANALAETFHLSAKEKPNKMVLKRWDRIEMAWPHEGRLELTKNATGPQAFKAVMEDYWKKFNAKTLAKHQASIRIGRDSCEEPNCKIANIECVPDLQGSWHAIPVKGISFFDCDQLNIAQSFYSPKQQTKLTPKKC